MTSEFIRQFDLMQAEVNKIRKAEEFAYSFGYNTHYCGGLSQEEYDNAIKEINDIVGNDWPKSVVNAYNEGAHQGYMDT